jgi:hypothetical protein
MSMLSNVNFLNLSAKAKLSILFCHEQKENKIENFS